MIVNNRVSKTLRDILDQGRTGMLVCESAGAKRRLFFDAGLLIGSRSDRQDELLGSVLVKKRRITAPQLAEAADRIRTGKRLGRILVELGFLTEEDVIRYVRGQVVDIACKILLEIPTRLLFSEGGEEEPVTSVSIVDVLMEAARRLPEIQHYRRYVLTDDQLLRRATESVVAHREASLSPDEALVLEQLESTRTTGDMVEAVPLDAGETVRILIGFLHAGIIALVHEETQPTSANANDVSSNPEDPIQREVARLYGVMQRQTDWEVLGLDSSAKLETVRRAYQERLARFHPDRYQNVQDAEFQQQLASVCARVSGAFNALAAQSEKQAPAPGASAPAPGASAPAPGVSAPAPGVSAPAPGVSAPAPGVSAPDASDNSEGADQRKNPAHARECYERAKIAFFEKDYWRAIELCRTAIEYGDNDADHFHLLGRALGQNSKWRKDAESNLQIAIKLKPFEPRYFVSLAELYHREGLGHRLRRAIEQLKAIDPTHEIPPGLLESSKSESTLSKSSSS